MKILHVIPSYKPAYIYGGPIISVSQLCEQQVLLNNSVSVYTTNANGLKSNLQVEVNKVTKVNGVSVTYFNRQSKGHSNISFQMVIALIRTAKKYDIIHIHSWWNFYVTFAVLVCWLSKIKPILSPRGMLSNYTMTSGKDKLKIIIGKLGGNYLLTKTILHATSIQEVQESQNFNPYWVHFIQPNIIPLPTRKYSKLNSNETLKLIYLSRIDEKKGLELLFKSLSAVKRDWSLNIYGKGEASYISKLKLLALKYNITNKIKWCGWIQGDQKYQALAKADVFVLTSKNENFANAALESCAVGTPVLLSKHVGFSEWVKKLNLGWVVKLDNQSISSTIESIHKEELYKQVNTIVDNIHRTFDPNNIAKQYIKAYLKYLE